MTDKEIVKTLVDTMLTLSDVYNNQIEVLTEAGVNDDVIDMIKNERNMVLAEISNRITVMTTKPQG